MKITGYSPLTFKSNDNNFTDLNNSDSFRFHVHGKINPISSTIKHFSNKNNNEQDDYLTNKGYKNVQKGLFVSSLAIPLSFLLAIATDFKNITKLRSLTKKVLLAPAIGIAIGILYTIIGWRFIVLNELSKGDPRNK